MNDKRVLVTGGSGLLGRHVVDALLSEGVDTTVLDLVAPTQSVPFLQCNVLDHCAVTAALKDFDSVIHLAGIDDGNDFPDQTYFETNVQGTWNVMHAAEAAGAQRMVVASSTATLGLGYQRPPDYLPVDEAHPLHPNDTYGLTKQLIEDVGRSFARNGDLRVVCLRPTLIVRPERERAILVQLSLSDPDVDAPADFISPDGVEPYGGLSATRTYVRSRDCARAFVAALDYDTAPFDVFNVAAADTIGRIDTLARFQQLFGHTPPLQSAAPYEKDAFASTLDTSKAHQLLGWSASGDWQQVLREHAAHEN